MHNQGKSIREISRELKIGTKKVRVWIKNWNSEGRLCNKKRGRKRKKICNQLKYFVEQETKLHRSMSCKSLSNKSKILFPQVSCSKTTIYRIRKLLKFDYKPPRIKQSLTEIQKAKEYFLLSIINRTKLTGEM
ncbi:transposable element-related [Anaeramoeba flamelloides]|uniref:Transposable element-related n=1 Tax=Anaeramoeba flamelloides TaxID=1746091 RepID=A0ABQ8YKM1_9EUKA|nr:transposable element-related [Anaeramoeba flamelloides]